MRNQSLLFFLPLIVACAVMPGTSAAQGSGSNPGDVAHAAQAMTPVIGVSDTALDFGCVTIGECAQASLTLSNDVADPESMLEITEINLTGDAEFTFLGPNPPFTIPGDGSSVVVDFEYCPTASGANSGSVEVVAAEATNSPLTVTLAGEGNALPVCDAGGPYTGTAGMAVMFDGSASSDDGATLDFAWEFGDGGTGAGATPSYTYAAAGTYTVTLTLTDSCGATSECATTATIDPGTGEPPTCDVQGDTAGNVGDTLNFDGSGSSDPDGTIESYDWDFGDGTGDSGAMVSHAYGAGGLYVVTLTVTDNDDLSSNCSLTVDINAAPECDAGGPYAGTINEDILFDGTGSSDPDGTIQSYDWDFGDGGTGTGATPTHAYTAQGTYFVTLCVTDDDGVEACCQTEVMVTNPTPVELRSFEALDHQGEVLLVWETTREWDHRAFVMERAEQGGEPIEIGRVEARGASRYELVDSTVEAGATYTYQLIAEADDGNQVVQGVAQVTVSRVVPTRVNVTSIHPNPFNPQTTVSFDLPESGAATLVVYNAAGQPVRTLVQTSLEAGAHQVRWDGLTDAGTSMPSGVYFVRLEASGIHITRKMVMTR